MMLAYYYDHTLGKFTDAAVAKGVNNVWDDDYVYSKCLTPSKPLYIRGLRAKCY